MPLPPRPRRPAAAPAPKKKPVALFVAVGAGAAVLVAVLAFALGGSPEAPPPPAVETPKPKAAPEITVRVYHLDLGRERVITALVISNLKPGPGEVALVDEAGTEYPPEPIDRPPQFIRELNRHPGALALKFRVPGGSGALDLRTPAGKTPVYRPDRGSSRPLPGSAPYEDWEIAATGTPGPDRFTLEVRAKPAADAPSPLDPKLFLLLTDTGEALVPEVQGRDPYRLAYVGIPKETREVRIQTSFRTERPAYLTAAFAPKAEAPAPAPKPDASPKPEPPKTGSARAAFEAKLPDGLAALKALLDHPGDEARRLARETLARIIHEDASAGLRAFAENKAELAERPLTRAALLAESYSPELSRQLMRMLFLMKQPRKYPTGCAECRGGGSAPCAGCQAGLAAGPCPRCDAKGHVDCLLCEGAGTMDHHGYKGPIVLTIGTDFKARNKEGKSGTLHAGKVTWQLSPCGGGAFQIQFESVTNCAHFKNTIDRGSERKKCGDFWHELKMFVFNGRARIQVPTPKGQLVPMSPTAAKRFLADYETCRSGRVTCDRCLGKRTDGCPTCSGRGKAMLLCTACEGTSLKACAACKGYGDASWVAKVLPPAHAGTLVQSLSEHAVKLRDWLDERARRASRKEDLARRLDEAKKGLDPTAKLTADVVEIACPRCKGNGSECEECWATGRREFFEGTAQYERYALAKRLERQVADAVKAPPEPPPLAALPPPEPAAAAVAAFKPVVIPDTARKSGVRAPVPGTVDEMIKLADSKHVTGKQHLEKAKSTTDQAVWVDEAARALNDLKEAQTLYASAQEKLDEMGIAVPRELLDKFRTNMQALVIARKTAP